MGNDFRIIFDAGDDERMSTPETLSEYVRGQLDPARTREVKRHLDKDWRARQMAEQLEETWNLLDCWSDQPAPADAAERFAQALSRELQREKFLDSPRVLARRSRNLFGTLLAPMAWAAAVVLICLSTFYAFHSVSVPGAPKRSRPQVVAKPSKPVAPVQLAQADDVMPTPITVKSAAPRRLLPPELERNYPHLAARLAAQDEQAPGLLGVDSPRLSSLLVAEEAGVMFDPINAVLDLGSSHDAKAAMASMAAQLDQFVARAAPDAPRPSDGGRQEPQH